LKADHRPDLARDAELRETVQGARVAVAASIEARKRDPGFLRTPEGRKNGKKCSSRCASSPAAIWATVIGRRMGPTRAAAGPSGVIEQIGAALGWPPWAAASSIAISKPRQHPDRGPRKPTQDPPT